VPQAAVGHPNRVNRSDAVSDNVDQLAADYLRRLEVATSGLPADRRPELIEEIAAHIAEAQAMDDLDVVVSR
jgi:hypothetical protein